MQARKRCKVTDSTVMIDRNQACEMFGLGWQTLDKIAIECGGRIKIGKRVLYKRSVLENHFNSLVD